MQSIHQFKIASLEGGEIDLAAYEGKKVLIVNVASECGLTPQYQQLEELYKEFQDKLVILGCPANNFGGQEPGTHEAIREFCTVRYGVTFPLAAKLDVTQHELYQWLTQKAKNGHSDSQVEWNFQKYLIDEKGQLNQVLSPTTSPLDDAILNWLGVNA